MDPALYYKIYREEIDEQVILKYTGYIKSYHLYNSAKNYIWRNRPKAEN